MSGFPALFVRFSFGLLCHALLLPMITNCRFGRRRCRLAWLGMFVLGSALAVPLILLVRNVSALFVTEAVFTLALYCAAYVFLSAGSKLRSLFAFTVYGTYFMFLLVFASCISQGLFAGSHYATTAIRTVFMLLYGVVLRFSPIVKGFRATAELDMGWVSPTIFSCVSCLTVYTTALSFSILQVDVRLRLAMAGILCLLITSAYAVAAHALRLLREREALRNAESQRKLLESQLAAEQEFVALAQARRHDARHHIALLTDYLEREDVAGMREYLSQYLTALDEEKLERYCENTVADALLRLTARRCREKGIPYTVQATIPEALSLTGPELAAVLGNILENAWEATEKAKRPHLSVLAHQRGESLMVEVENTVDRPSRFEGELPLTTKPAGGQGLKSVQRTLERHGGMLQCSRSGELFYTQVVIPL